MREQIIRTEIRPLLDTILPDYKFVSVQYYPLTKKYCVVVEIKFEGVLHMLQGSGASICNVASDIRECYDFLTNGVKREKHILQ